MTGEHLSHHRKLQKISGLNFAGGADIQDGAGFVLHSGEDLGYGWSVNAGEPAYIKQGGGNTGAGISGADQTVRSAVVNCTGGKHNRGVGLSAHPFGGVFFHTNDFTGVDNFQPPGVVFAPSKLAGQYLFIADQNDFQFGVGEEGLQSSIYRILGGEVTAHSVQGNLHSFILEGVH
jgi:hypothetical protein